jgi:hypothetical protein
VSGRRGPTGQAQPVKKRFLVCYDYGMGGVWAIIDAHSSDEIIQRYPMLNVKEARPPWMNDDLYSSIVARSFDIDDPPPDWLVSAVEVTS